MANESESKSPLISKTALTATLIAVSTIVLFAAILVPPYLRDRAEGRRSTDFVANAQPVLDALIEAEAKHKESNGKFWRDAEQTLSAEATKAKLGVDLGPQPGFRVVIYPPDLVADPTLRIAARGTGPMEGLTLECVYDSIEKSKGCKLIS